MPTQRGSAHEHRNLLAHAPETLHGEITADYNDMIYAETGAEVTRRRKLFIAKWPLKRRAVADSLEEAGGRMFTFTRQPASQWKSARTANAIERLHEEFKRRIKTVLPSAETAAMLFWSLLAAGQITMRKVDGWPSLGQPPSRWGGKAGTCGALGVDKPVKAIADRACHKPTPSKIECRNPLPVSRLESIPAIFDP